MKHQKVMLAVFALLVEASFQTLAQDQTVASTNGWPYGPYDKHIVKAPAVVWPSEEAALANLAARMTNRTYRVSLTNAVLLIANQRLPWAKDRPVERLALLFTKFDADQATYKWLYFNPI